MEDYRLKPGQRVLVVIPWKGYLEKRFYTVDYDSEDLKLEGGHRLIYLKGRSDGFCRGRFIGITEEQEEILRMVYA